MPVEPVYVPPAGKAITPGQEIGAKVSSPQYWANKATEARAMREYEEEQKNIEAIRNPQQPQEPPIKIGGSINLGNFDLQEQGRIAAANAEATRKSAEERAIKAEETAERLRGDLIAATINNLQTSLGGQITKLQADIAGSKGSAKSIGDQLKEIMDITAVLGYVKPGTETKAPVVQNATDAAISLEMLRLQLEDKRTERSFAWQMEKDRRQFQLDLKKLDQANHLAIAQMAGQKERDALLWKAPEIIGATIAKGLISSRGGGAVASQPPPQRRAPAPRPAEQAEDIESQAPDSMANKTLTAGVGEAGSIECPECGQPIAVGPTASRAVCAGCEYTVDIIRKGAA